MSTGGENHTHHFDPISGWCHHCNLRNDGRLLGKGGDIFRPGQGYTPAELHTIRQTIEGTRA